MQMNSNRRLDETTLPQPQTGVLRSSEQLPWNGVLFEQRYHPAI